jgi:hypothetical protein
MMEDRELEKWRMEERIALETEDDKPTKIVLVNTRGGGCGEGTRRRRMRRRGRRIHVAEEVFLELKIVFRCKDLFVRSPLSS